MVLETLDAGMVTEIRTGTSITVERFDFFLSPYL